MGLHEFAWIAIGPGVEIQLVGSFAESLTRNRFLKHGRRGRYEIGNERGIMDDG